MAKKQKRQQKRKVKVPLWVIGEIAEIARTYPNVGTEFILNELNADLIGEPGPIRKPPCDNCQPKGRCDNGRCEWPCPVCQPAVFATWATWAAQNEGGWRLAAACESIGDFEYDYAVAPWRPVLGEPQAVTNYCHILQILCERAGFGIRECDGLEPAVAADYIQESLPPSKPVTITETRIRKLPGESVWLVMAYSYGKRHPAADCEETSREAAKQTAAAMVQPQQ